NSTAENNDIGGQDARYSSQENAPPFKWAFQILGPFLNAHSPRDFTHRGEQRQVAARVLDCLIGDCGDARFHDCAGQALVCGKMEVCEYRLARPHRGPFLGQRLLYLDDKVRPLPDILIGSDNLSAVLAIKIIADAATLAGA